MMRWWMRNFLMLEGGLSLLATFFFGVWLYKINGVNLFVSDPSGYFLVVYAALTTLFGALLGFIVASITFLFGALANDTFIVLRASRSYSDHWAIFKAALKACFFATFICLIGLVLLLKGEVLSVLLLATFGVIIWVFFRLARVVWVIGKMIDAEVQAGSVSRDEKFSK